MTARHEKPSPHESSTDTLIDALNSIANDVENQNWVQSMALREAAQRLDKLERELEQLRGEK